MKSTLFIINFFSILLIFSNCKKEDNDASFEDGKWIRESKSINDIRGCNTVDYIVFPDENTVLVGSSYAISELIK